MEEETRAIEENNDGPERAGAPAPESHGQEQAGESAGAEAPAEPAMFQGPEADTGPKPYPSFLSHLRRGFWD